jgi:DNA-binding GntR family transcriptional regulator
MSALSAVAPALDRPLGAALGPAIAPGAGRSMREEVYERLRAAILDVRLAPGQAVSENEIADLLRVSRTPIREALQRLAGEGLVQVVPQVGTYVARMDLARIREALFVRESIECTALSRLPAHLPGTDIQALERIVSDHRRAVRGDQLTPIFAADEAFHRTLLTLAGVPGAWRYVREARELHRRVRVLGRVSSDSARRSVGQHGAVVAELAAGRRDAATELMRQHIRMNAALADDIAARHPNYFLEAR